MAKKKLGKKHQCYQCGCKFYDLKRAHPICPKCGADQNETPKKGSSQTTSQATVVSASTTRTRSRKRKVEEWDGSGGSFSDDENDASMPLEDGLSLVEEDELPEED